MIKYLENLKYPEQYYIQGPDGKRYNSVKEYVEMQRYLISHKRKVRNKYKKTYPKLYIINMDAKSMEGIKVNNFDEGLNILYRYSYKIEIMFSRNFDRIAMLQFHDICESIDPVYIDFDILYGNIKLDGRRGYKDIYHSTDKFYYNYMGKTYNVENPLVCSLSDPRNSIKYPRSVIYLDLSYIFYSQRNPEDYDSICFFDIALNGCYPVAYITEYNNPRPVIEGVKRFVFHDKYGVCFIIDAESEEKVKEDFSEYDLKLKCIINDGDWYFE